MWVQPTSATHTKNYKGGAQRDSKSVGEIHMYDQGVNVYACVHVYTHVCRKLAGSNRDATVYFFSPPWGKGRGG